jgi:hypothetical protein
MGKRTNPRLTEDEVKELARQIYKGEIFTSWQVGQHDLALLPSIFMPLGLMDRSTKLKFLRDAPEMLYAPMSAAGPRGINGYPMFFEMSFVNKVDADRVWDEYQSVKQSLEA